MGIFNWDLLEDMLTSDFWTLGGTSEFFTDTAAAQQFAEQYVINPYDGISTAEKEALLEYSDEAFYYAELARGVGGYLGLNNAEYEQYGNIVTQYEAANIYWQRMTDYIKTNLNDPWLKGFFTGQTEISQETIDYVEAGIVDWTVFKDTLKTDSKKHLWLAAAALAFLFWRK